MKVLPSPPVVPRPAPASAEPSGPAPFALAAPSPLAGSVDRSAIAFEAVVLRTFVEAMLPKDGFGEGTAGHMWRGQMAGALADTIARNGGVGIADTIAKDVS